MPFRSVRIRTAVPIAAHRQNSELKTADHHFHPSKESFLFVIYAIQDAWTAPHDVRSLEGLLLRWRLRGVSHAKPHPRSALRPPNTGQKPKLHGHRNRDARAEHWRQHGHLQRCQRCPPPALALSGLGSPCDPLDDRPQPGARPRLRPRLRRVAVRKQSLRRDGGVPRRYEEFDRKRNSRASPRSRCHREPLPVTWGSAGYRGGLWSRESEGGSRECCDPKPPPLGETIRIGSC